MVQIRVGDIILDLYEFDPPKLNFAIEDITDTSARSEFTRTFRIPATPNNNQFFETAFEINGQDFDVTVKIQADLYVDGNLFRQGELRLNNIYITRENEKIDYECVFFGVSRNLWTAIGEGTLNQLNLSGYNHTLTTQQIVDSWQAYPEGANTDGIFNGDIIYPLVDFGNTYDDNGDPQEGEISIISGTGLLPFTNSSSTHRLQRERFKPWIRAKVIWDEIFNEAGFTYTSNFLSGDTFRNLYVSAHGNTANIYTEFLGNIAYAGNGGESDGEEVDLVVGTQGYDFGGNIVNGRYVIPTTGSYAFSYQLIGDGLSSTDVSITLRLRNGATTIDSVTQFITIDPADPEFVFNLTGSFSDTFTAGDEININFGSNATLSYLGTLRVTDAPSDMVISPLLAEDYKKLDFIKDIITKHRLVLAPDKNDSNNFIIEPWVNYIGSGDLFDWTKKLDVSKDFKIQPLFYTQKSKIEYTDSEGGDVYNQVYLDQFEEVYGTLRVFSNNELLEGERQIKTEVIPLLVTQVRGAQAANNGMDNCIIPQLTIHEPEETGTQFLPIDSKNRYGYYNGLKDVNTSGFSAIDWYVEADGAGATGFTYYPMISPYNEFPVSATTIDFNWQREEGFIKYGLHNEFVGSSMYDVYWSSYINSLYDKWARRVTAYFVLNAEDLINFSFDDVIFIKDAYYYVEKIYDVPMGEKTSVKVDLIKLINYNELEQVRPRSLCIDDEDNTYYNGTYYPLNNFVVGENLTNISGDTYTIDLTSTASTFYDTYSATTSASTKAFLFYEKSNKPIYNWYIYEYVSGTPTSGNTLTIDASKGIVSGSSSTFKTDAFVPDAATDGDCDCSVIGDVPCEDVQTIRLRRTDGNIQEQNACFRSTGINAYLDFIGSNPIPNDCESVYTVNCTGSTKYEIWTGTSSNGETVVLFNQERPGIPSPPPLDRFYTQILVSGTIGCGNTITLRGSDSGEFGDCVWNVWCQVGGVSQYCTTPRGVQIPSVCACGLSPIEIRYNVC